METRHILLIVALLATMIFVIPAVYSLFAGQHMFYTSGNSYCLKCHADIKGELDSSGHHISFTCENCHALDMNPDQTHDKVVTLRCLDCHGIPPRLVIDSNENTVMSPIAGIFGENITNEESHNPFVIGANDSSLMKGENEACISCHTRKTLDILMNIADTYNFDANRIIDSTWQLDNYSKNTETGISLLIQSGGSIGQHSFPLISSINCEKCHPNKREELTSSIHHTHFSCQSCHQISSTYHASSVPSCLACHGTSPGSVTDQLGNTYTAPPASVYADNQSSADAHRPFVLSSISSNLSEDSNPSCSSCHSSYNTKISYTRPEFIEWDVVNSAGTWVIGNLAFGPPKDIVVTKQSDGEMHNISLPYDMSCISCHDDIRQAVSLGGHSNEQWMQKHNYTGYVDMNSYCRSCHNPSTQDISGASPFPEYPFNSPIHGAMVLSCLDCHGRSGSIFVNINGGLMPPPYDSSKMGGIETSIGQQPSFVQSYLCMACKNTDNPVPGTSLHFKMFTEPLATVEVDMSGAGSIVPPSPTIVSGTGLPDPGSGMQWQMTFSDEFEGSTIDTSKWNGGYANLQWCGGGQCAQQFAGLSVSGGILYLQPTVLSNYSTDYQYRAMMHTGGLSASTAKFSQKYGYFEVRSKFPHNNYGEGNGLWPSFWALPLGKTDNSHFGGPGVQQEEVDILESVLGTSNMHYTYLNLHDYRLGQYSIKYPYTSVGDLSHDFHTYGLYWRNDGSPHGSMQAYFDGVPQSSPIVLDSRSNYWDNGIYLILQVIPCPLNNQPFGSGSGCTQTTSNNNPFQIDYVRAYRAVSVSTP